MLQRNGQLRRKQKRPCGMSQTSKDECYPARNTRSNPNGDGQAFEGKSYTGKTFFPSDIDTGLRLLSDIETSLCRRIHICNHAQKMPEPGEFSFLCL